MVALADAWRQVAAIPAALPTVQPTVDTYQTAGQLSVSLDVETTRQLLGEVSNGSYYKWKQNPRGKTLDPDMLARISYLIGIFKSLNILYSQRLADQWMRLPNTNPIFAGRTPLGYILHGGQQAMEIVRRLLDARRGGR